MRPCSRIYYLNVS